MIAIECRDVVKRFKSVTALDHMDLTVEKNGIFGLLGPNGAGKTTLIRILTGLITPTSGTCRVMGTDVGDTDSDHRFGIGYLSQDPKYYPWMTGRELLFFVGRLFGMPLADIRKRADELLAMAGLSKAADRKIGGYSGGMVQRLGIAQALFHQPEILFLDEPVSALDPIGRKEVLEFIASLGEGMSVCMSTHILADVERICSSVAIMDEGKVKLVGRTEELLAGVSGGMSLISFASAADAEKMGAQLDLQGVPHVLEADRIRIAADLFEKHRGVILRSAADGNLRLSTITRERADLEEVFVDLIQGGRTYGKR